MKRYCVILLVVCLSLLVSLAYADGQEETQRTFTLPAALKEIDDEAFSGTAAEVVILQENVESIGENAFSDIPTLTDIYIPQATSYIAQNGFTDTDTAIHGAAGSYAERWAKEHGYRFIREDIWVPTGRTVRLLKLRAVYPSTGAVSLLLLFVIYLMNRLYTRNRKRVKDYPELYAIDLVFP